MSNVESLKQLFNQMNTLNIEVDEEDKLRCSYTDENKELKEINDENLIERIYEIWQVSNENEVLDDIIAKNTGSLQKNHEGGVITVTYNNVSSRIPRKYFLDNVLLNNDGLNAKRNNIDKRIKNITNRRALSRAAQKGAKRTRRGNSRQTRRVRRNNRQSRRR